MLVEEFEQSEHLVLAHKMIDELKAQALKTPGVTASSASRGSR